MSNGEVKFVSKNSVKSCGIMKTDQVKGKHSFLITVDNNGVIEVCPKEQMQEEKCICQQSKCNLKSKGKQRIRIALIEEEAGSSEEDPDVSDDKNDTVSIDAQSFEAMHDRFVKIYNKNLGGKPSFVVLEDALMRKRIEETLQDHYNRHTCHCHAQQQTSSCDIGAHTGSQTDEFLLQYALRSQMKALSSSSSSNSRGCQASDISVERPHTSSTISSSKRSLHVPSRPNNQSDATTTTNSGPQVSISFITPSAATLSPVVQPQPQQLLQPANSSNCNNCCLQLPATANSFYCLPANGNNCTACFIRQPQQQQQHQQQQCQQQQQCHSSCCLLRPSLAQTTLGYGIPSNCNQQMLLIPEIPTQQQHQEFPHVNWPPQSYNPCFYYPLNAFGAPTCASCQQQQQQPQQQQHVFLADANNQDVNYSSSLPINSTLWKPQSKSEAKKTDQSTELDNCQSPMTAVTPASNEKLKKRVRHKAGGNSSKMYMARFGRTCLILKPNVSPMPPRSPTNPNSCSTSDMALP